MSQSIDSQKINTWQAELRSSLKTPSEIQNFFNLNFKLTHEYKQFLPLSFANKIIALGPQSALWKQFVPTHLENTLEGSLDPIGDLKNQKAAGIIHRYKNRILFAPTPNCPIICRYCFRKNELSKSDNIFSAKIKELGHYLDLHPEVNEVILTGGDPLILDNNKLENLLEFIAAKNIEFLRIHTRTPIILPKRIDEGFITLLQKYSSKFSQLVFVLHTNHTDELDKDVIKALLKISKLNIQKLTQSVLLKGVNDNEEQLINLFTTISRLGFTPYYLHHPDNVKGANHFKISLEEGRRLYSKLRDQISGWMLPHYVIDHPDGSGKQLAFNPESIEFSGKLLNLRGDFSEYSSLNT